VGWARGRPLTPRKLETKKKGGEVQPNNQERKKKFHSDETKEVNNRETNRKK